VRLREGCATANDVAPARTMATDIIRFIGEVPCTQAECPQHTPYKSFKINNLHGNYFA
jgi:hypothetical protein